MKQKKAIGIAISVVLLIAAVSSLLAWNFYNAAKDYKKVLAVERRSKDVSRNPSREGEKKEDNFHSAGEGLPKSDAEIAEKGETPQDVELNQFEGSNTINILFLGIDRDEERDKTLGIYRTDTIALANINLDTKAVNVLCIPRDTYAYVPAKDKMDKINHAYAFGSVKAQGIESTIEAIEHFIKYDRVDYYFLIDMEPVPEIVDTLGGIELDVDTDIKGYGAEIKKGRQILDGKQALAYIRWRYSGNGDIDRIKRQQKLIKAMYEKLRQTDQMINAIRIVLGYSSSVKTNMSLKQLIALSMLFKDVSSDSATTLIIPGKDRMMNKVWYYVPDEKKTEELLISLFNK